MGWNGSRSVVRDRSGGRFPRAGRTALRCAPEQSGGYLSAGCTRERRLFQRPPEDAGRQHAGPGRPGPSAGRDHHGRCVTARSSATRSFGKKAIGGPPMTKDTIFRIYSQTKPVTGVAMMILFEEGKWRLDDPVTKFVPEFANLRVYKGQNADGTFITEPPNRAADHARDHEPHGRLRLRPACPTTRSRRPMSRQRRAGLQDPGRVHRPGQAAPGQPAGREWRYSVSVDIQG
jgi:CubicO group peptidase (beta-lactamase class C family)